MFEKLTMFDFKFILLCSLVCSLPVIPGKDDQPNLDGIFKTISNFSQSHHCPHRAQSKRFSDKNMLKASKNICARFLNFCLQKDSDFEFLL